MANPYAELHLELLEIPDNYERIVEEEGRWENDDLTIFYLIINKTDTGILHGLDLLPFEDESDEMEALHRSLEERGCDISGYGWESYLLGYLEDHHPAIAGRIQTDSESDTCGLYLDGSLEEYREMLRLVSDAVRQLTED